MLQTVAPILIGQLMVQSGIIDEDLLTIALEKSKDCRVKIGQILLYSGLISDHELKAVLVALELIRNSQVNYEQAIEALQLVSQQRFPYQATLAKARWLKICERENELPKLMLDAGVIGMQELGLALASSIDQEESFGRALLRAGNVDQRARVAAVEAIVLCRTGVITYQHAVAALRAAFRTKLPVRELVGLREAPLRAIGREFVLKGKLLPFGLADFVEETLQCDLLWYPALPYSELIDCLKQLLSLFLEQFGLDGSIPADEELDLSIQVRALLNGIEAKQIIQSAQNASRRMKLDLGSARIPAPKPLGGPSYTNTPYQAPTCK